MANKPVSITAATVTLSRNLHTGAVIRLDAPGGCTVTLPAALGRGDEYELVVGTALTTSSYIVQVANTVDILQGTAAMQSATAAGTTGFPTTATSDTITMGGTTTGGLVGSRIVIKDMKSGVFSVTATLGATGTGITPFSAAV